MLGDEEKELSEHTSYAVLAAVRAGVAGARVDRLAVTYPADDDNLWFIQRAEGAARVQIGSHRNGRPPFLIESDQHDRRVTAVTVQEAIDVIEDWLLGAH